MNNSGKIGRAPGFEDRAGPDLLRVEVAAQMLRSGFSRRGYAPIETPLIELTELFLRMSGGLLSSQLFDFTSPDGGSVSVRPEMTSPVIRHALENQISLRPQRYQYAAPIVRYSERPYDAPPNIEPSRRQFTQVGAELIGSSSPAADGEIIAMAYEGTKSVVDSPVAVRIGHVGLIWTILSRLDLSGRAQLFLANKVGDPKLRAYATDTVESMLGEMSYARPIDYRSHTSAISDLISDMLRREAAELGFLTDESDRGDDSPEGELLRRLVTGGVKLPYQHDQTSRSAREIVERLKRKLDEPHNAGAFSDAVKLVSKLSLISGELNDVLERIASVTNDFGIGHLKDLDNLAYVAGAAIDEGVERDDLSIDIGLATGFAYYTGMIFDVSSKSAPIAQRWGGGGRYDRLASALGSVGEIPALGFALNLDAMLPPIESTILDAKNSRLVLVAPDLSASTQTVGTVAADLRAQGFCTFTLFEPLTDISGMGAALRAAKIAYVDAAGGVEIEDL